MKKCDACQVPQEDSQFAIKRNGKVNRNCQTCISKSRAHYQKNKAEKQKYQRERYHDPVVKESQLAYQADWFQNNPGYLTNYNKTRKQTDALYKLRMESPGRLKYWAFKTKKIHKFIEELGCSAAEFRAHIELLFPPGMTWDNYGRGSWVFDHKFPLSVAHKSGEDVLRKALSYRNVQPLWDKDNYSKSTNLPPEWPTVEAFMAAW
jgi:hypothetical protein